MMADSDGNPVTRDEVLRLLSSSRVFDRTQAITFLLDNMVFDAEYIEAARRLVGCRDKMVFELPFGGYAAIYVPLGTGSPYESDYNGSVGLYEQYKSQMKAKSLSDPFRQYRI